MPSTNPDLTPRLQLPSPKPADPPDVPGDIKALADKIDELLGRHGAFAYATRGSASVDGSDWEDLSMTFSGGAVVDQSPAGAWSVTNTGLVVPWAGVYVTQLQMAIDTSSAFTNRLNVQIGYGATGTEGVAGEHWFMRDAMGTGSFELQVVGRAVKCAAGDRFRPRLKIVSGATGVVIDNARLSAWFVGDGK